MRMPFTPEDPNPLAPAKFGLIPLNNQVSTLHVGYYIPYHQWRDSFNDMPRLRPHGPIGPPSGLLAALDNKQFTGVKTLTLELLNRRPEPGVDQPQTPSKFTQEVASVLRGAGIDTLVLLRATEFYEFDMDFLIREGSLLV